MNAKSGFIALQLLLWALLQLSSGTLHAQNTSSEFWPETDIWYRLSPAFHLSAFIPVGRDLQSQVFETFETLYWLQFQSIFNV